MENVNCCVYAAYIHNQLTVVLEDRIYVAKIGTTMSLCISLKQFKNQNKLRISYTMLFIGISGHFEIISLFVVILASKLDRNTFRVIFNFISLIAILFVHLVGVQKAGLLIYMWTKIQNLNYSHISLVTKGWNGDLNARE